MLDLTENELFFSCLWHPGLFEEGSPAMSDASQFFGICGMLAYGITFGSWPLQQQGVGVVDRLKPAVFLNVRLERFFSRNPKGSHYLDRSSVTIWLHSSDNFVSAVYELLYEGVWEGVQMENYASPFPPGFILHPRGSGSPWHGSLGGWRRGCTASLLGLLLSGLGPITLAKTNNHKHLTGIHISDCLTLGSVQNHRELMDYFLPAFSPFLPTVLHANPIQHHPE